MTTPSLEDRLRRAAEAAMGSGEVPMELLARVAHRRSRRTGTAVVMAASAAAAVAIVVPVTLVGHHKPQVTPAGGGGAPTTSPSAIVATTAPAAVFAPLTPAAVPADKGEPATFLALTGAGGERLAVVDSQTGAVKKWLQQQGSQALMTFNAGLSTAYQPDLRGCTSTWTQVDTSSGATSAAFADLGRPLEVALAPAGERLAYVHLQGGSLTRGCPTGTESLVVIDRTSGVTKSWPIGPGGADSLYPAFDPTGIQIAFVRDRRVWVLDVNRDTSLADARPLSQAAPDTGCQQSKPAWRPGTDSVLVALQCRTSAAIVGYDASSGVETYRHDLGGTDPLLASYAVDASGAHVIYALSGSFGQPGGNVYAVEPHGDRHIADGVYQVAW
jgi:hypothetical protein